MTIIESDLELTTADVQDILTALEMPCPDCQLPMLGARCFDPTEQAAYIGVVCPGCDKAYKVRI